MNSASRGLSRRTVLAAGSLPALAGFAGSAMPEPAASPTRTDLKPPRQADVVVCGGGLSGMVAALRLHQSGARVLVLEAAPRLGGRAYTVRSPAGMHIDLGAQFVGPSQDRLIALAEELAIPAFKAYGTGDGLLEFGGRTFRLPEGELALPEEDLEEFARLAGELDRLAASIDLTAPERSPDALRLDSRTYADWIDAHTSRPLPAAFLRLAATGLLGVSPGEISVLFIAWYIAHGDSLDMLLTTRGGAQDSRFVGGLQQFAERITDIIGRQHCLLSTPVSRLVQSGGSVRIEAGPELIEAQYAVVAMPPGAVDLIAFDPPLPVSRRELQVRAPMGRYMKAVCTYERAFWRDQGFNGEVVSLDGAVFGVFDESDGDGFALLAFAGGDSLTQLQHMPPDARRAAILDELARHFGPESRTPTEYIEYDWGTDPWSRGGPVMCLPPGALSRLGSALHAPAGRVYWAGTEAAVKWTGYLDGAIRAGEAAAAGILPGLKL